MAPLPPSRSSSGPASRGASAHVPPARGGEPAPDTYALLYVSRPQVHLSNDELRQILKTSQRNNEAVGITGRLVYAAAPNESGLFVQWLEGEGWRVRHLFYGAIVRDPRHAVVGRPFEGAIAARQFDDWTMGFARMQSEAEGSAHVEELLALAQMIQPAARASRRP